jgi:hypothetical protein
MAASSFSDAGFSLFPVAATSENLPLGDGRERLGHGLFLQGVGGVTRASLQFCSFCTLALQRLLQSAECRQLVAAEVVMPAGASLHRGPAGPRFGMQF